jgi:hypothetical protein
MEKETSDIFDNKKQDGRPGRTARYRCLHFFIMNVNYVEILVLERFHFGSKYSDLAILLRTDAHVVLIVRCSCRPSDLSALTLSQSQTETRSVPPSASLAPWLCRCCLQQTIIAIVQLHIRHQSSGAGDSQ